MDYFRIEDLFGSQFWNVVGIIIGISGILYTIQSNRKSKKSKLLGFKIKTDEFLNLPRLDELKIFYEKKAINNLLVTKILLMNEGNDLILNSDISSKQPVIIRNTKQENNILKYELLYETKPSNNITLKNTVRGIHIDFDYLNPNEGCIIQISHSLDNETLNTNDLNSDEIFKLEGEIKGFGSLVPLMPLDRNRSSIELLILFPSMFLIIFFLLGIIDYFLRNNPEYLKYNILPVIFYGVFFISLYLIFLIYRSIDRFIKNRDLVKNDMLDKL